MRKKNKTLRFLFVCSGNTCRSPMAEAVFNKMAKEKGLDAVAFSAGLYADGKSPITKETDFVLKGRGITDYEHTSVKFTPEMCKDADFIVGMTEKLARKIADDYPKLVRGKIYNFPSEVADPYTECQGLGLGIYAYECLLDETIMAVNKITRTIYGV